MIITATEPYKHFSDEDKLVNASAKETNRNEQQLSSPSVRISVNSCYFVSLFWLNSLGEQKVQLS